MAKQLSYNEGIKKQQSGINQVVDMMKITIGPRGKNVSLTNGEAINDGRRIAEDVFLKDPIENKGADRVRKLVRSISSEVGGGRTACAIMYQELVNEGLELVDTGHNVNDIKKGMNLAVKDISAKLDEMAQDSKGKLEQIATISTESPELGRVIAETMEKVGKDGIVTVEQSQTFGITSEIAEGLKFDKGYISPYMANNERQEAEYKDIPVFITDGKISSFGEIQPILDELRKAGKKDLLIIAEDLDAEALRVCILSQIKGIFNTLAIKIPGIGDLKKFCLEDLCALTGAELYTEHNKEVKLGHVRKVLSKKDSTIILGNNVDTWISTLKTRRELTDNKWEKDQFDERIAKLQNGIAVIKVGDSSEDEVKYLKLKIEDGINETKRAMEEGIITGGNVAFINALKKGIKAPQYASKEIKLGYNIVLDAIVSPLRQIIENCQKSPRKILKKILKSDSETIGFNALTNEVVDDMYDHGIIDAVKVVKTVLKFSVTEAALFLTLGGDISELPDNNK